MKAKETNRQIIWKIIKRMVNSVEPNNYILRKEIISTITKETSLDKSYISQNVSWLILTLQNNNYLDFVGMNDTKGKYLVLKPIPDETSISELNVF